MRGPNRKPNTLTHKWCTKCSSYILFDLFSKNKSKKDGLCSFCKDCSLTLNKAYCENNKNRENIVVPKTKKCGRCKTEKEGLEFYKCNRERDGLTCYCKDCQGICNRFVKFGVTEEWYKATLEAQGGACAICKLVFTKDNPPCVDHDHLTYEPRGLLCRGCNTGIGLLQDKVGVLKSGAAYLEKYGGS